MARKPLTVRQLDIILELILKEELMSLEHDIRTLYSTLCYTRAYDDQDNFDESSDVVTLRHSSFYEFFRMSKESGLIHVDVDPAEVSFLYVCLYALNENQTPSSKRSTSSLWGYAPRNSCHHILPVRIPKRRESYEAIFRPCLRVCSAMGKVQGGSFRSCILRGLDCTPSTTCDLSELGTRWLDAQDRDTANERAEVVLHWLLPGQTQRFMNYARSSAMTSDACPFTILLSFMVACWRKCWLDPEEIKEDDGLPAIAPAILTVYDSMANKVRGTNVEDIASKVSDVMWITEYLLEF